MINNEQPTIDRAKTTTDHTRGPALAHIDAWVFDLDNTLYSASNNLFKQVDLRISAFVADLLDIDTEAARVIQKDYWRRYGTTMRGLMIEHGVDPGKYMDFVHQIDHGPVQPAPELDAVLGRIDGAKYIFTNASVDHADKVLARLGVAHHFDAIWDIVAADFNPKPNDHFYDEFIDAHTVDPRSAVLVEDMAINLKPGHERGMTTVHIHTESVFAMEGHDADWVHHSTDDLVSWLDGVVGARQV